jgi:hypothetical protein
MIRYWQRLTVPRGAEIQSSGESTHESDKELDYLVTNENMGNPQVFARDRGISDHRAVQVGPTQPQPTATRACIGS